MSCLMKVLKINVIFRHTLLLLIINTGNRHILRWDITASTAVILRCFMKK